MSLPRQVPSHSSSPSKSSLRRTSGTQNPSRTLLPSPHFEEPLPHRSTPALDEEAIGEESAQIVSEFFQPFFALIEDSVTHEHHHPTVHYIFADDDGDIITEAAFRSLEVENASGLPEQSQRQGTHEEESRLPPHDPQVREHYLILDVQSTGTGASYEVTSAQSLSSEWQILHTNITAAPTFNAEASDAEDGLMLKIEGRGGTPPGSSKEKQNAHEETENLEAMLERFQKSLDDIKRTMEAGGHLTGGPPQEHLEEQITKE